MVRSCSYSYPCSILAHCSVDLSIKTRTCPLQCELSQVKTLGMTGVVYCHLFHCPYLHVYMFTCTPVELQQIQVWQTIESQQYHAPPSSKKKPVNLHLSFVVTFCRYTCNFLSCSSAMNVVTISNVKWAVASQKRECTKISLMDLKICCRF